MERVNTLHIGVPNEKQKLFLQCRAKYIAFGGARGGGKSWAVRTKAKLMALRYPGIRMLLARRTLGEVWDNHVLPLQQDLQGIARYREAEKAFLFANGSRLRFGYCDSERDVLQYQGQEYDVIFLDEATQFTEFQFFTLTACLRGTGSCPRRMYLTCNPGGVGHGDAALTCAGQTTPSSRKAPCGCPAACSPSRRCIGAALPRSGLPP